jgi:hypothetical protein
MSTRNKLKNPLVISFLLAILISVGLVYGTLRWLDVYTLHNQGIIVPNVKGLPLDEAKLLIQRENLRYNVIDSVFLQTARPGSIVEVSPSIGSKVKQGRILYLTLNARAPRQVPVPTVKDMSYRQAYALLRSRGFESLEVEYVPGEYKDLAIGLEYRGRPLREGEQLPQEAHLVLKISNGMGAAPDSVAAVPAPEEGPWF